MELPFTTLDVFTTIPFKGNPLAVVIVPPSYSALLSQAQKQVIAREFNFSETVFVHDVEDAGITSRRIDIFTPEAELPFAGHPTMGTAVLLRSQGVSSLLSKAGPIIIEALDDGSARLAVPHNVRLHQKRAKDDVARIFDDSIGELELAELDSPIFSIVNGMAFILVELPSLELLATAKIPVSSSVSAEVLDEGWRSGWVTRHYYYVRTGTEVIGGRRLHKIRTRMMRPGREDPATGSAASALCGYLSLSVLDEDSPGFEITQGVEMGRDSTIVVDVGITKDADGTKKISNLYLGGNAVEITKGTIAAELRG
ncbi:hypothetical protein G7046_g3581 [Stylonectria norvegica]|nr:hypothetical protein G7046_g3581 [Stylonectria norvegica]